MLFDLICPVMFSALKYPFSEKDSGSFRIHRKREAAAHRNTQTGANSRVFACNISCKSSFSRYIQISVIRINGVGIVGIYGK